MNPKPPDFTRTIFLDRSFGGYRLAGLLRKVGIDVHAHKECSWLNSDAEDQVWIPVVTSKGWVIFTSDKRISKDPVNVRAVMESKAQVIITIDNGRLPEFWGAAFLVGRLKIHEILRNNPGPVFIQVSHCSGDHVKIVRQSVTHPQPLTSKPADAKVQQKASVADFSYIKF